MSRVNFSHFYYFIFVLYLTWCLTGTARSQDHLQADIHGMVVMPELPIERDCYDELLNRRNEISGPTTTIEVYSELFNEYDGRANYCSNSALLFYVITLHKWGDPEGARRVGSAFYESWQWSGPRIWPRDAFPDPADPRLERIAAELGWFGRQSRYTEVYARDEDITVEGPVDPARICYDALAAIRLPHDIVDAPPEAYLALADAHRASAPACASAAELSAVVRLARLGRRDEAKNLAAAWQEDHRLVQQWGVPGLSDLNLDPLDPRVERFAEHLAWVGDLETTLSPQGPYGLIQKQACEEETTSARTTDGDTYAGKLNLIARRYRLSAPACASSAALYEALFWFRSGQEDTAATLVKAALDQHVFAHTNLTVFPTYREDEARTPGASEASGDDEEVVSRFKELVWGLSDGPATGQRQMRFFLSAQIVDRDPPSFSLPADQMDELAASLGLYNPDREQRGRTQIALGLPLNTDQDFFREHLERQFHEAKVRSDFTRAELVFEALLNQLGGLNDGMIVGYGLDYVRLLSGLDRPLDATRIVGSILNNEGCDDIYVQGPWGNSDKCFPIYGTALREAYDRRSEEGVRAYEARRQHYAAINNLADERSNTPDRALALAWLERRGSNPAAALARLELSLNGISQDSDLEVLDASLELRHARAVTLLQLARVTEAMVAFVDVERGLLDRWCPNGLLLWDMEQTDCRPERAISDALVDHAAGLAAEPRMTAATRLYRHASDIVLARTRVLYSRHSVARNDFKRSAPVHRDFVSAAWAAATVVQSAVPASNAAVLNNHLN